MAGSARSKGDFDPYQEWLSIPPEEQPPNHYRLLGVKLFERDKEVIEDAADQRLARIKSFAHGPHGRESQMLLNAIAQAKVCLVRPHSRKKYDARLRSSGSSTPSTFVKSTQFATDLNRPVVGEIEPLTELVPTDYFDETYLVVRPTRPRSRIGVSQRRRMQRRRFLFQVAYAGVGGAVLLLLIFKLMSL